MKLNINEYNKTNESNIKSKVENYLCQLIEDRFGDWFIDISDNITAIISSKFKDYNPDWSSEDYSEIELDKFYTKVTDSIVDFIYKDLFKNYK